MTCPSSLAAFLRSARLRVSFSPLLDRPRCPLLQVIATESCSKISITIPSRRCRVMMLVGRTVSETTIFSRNRHTESRLPRQLPHYLSLRNLHCLYRLHMRGLDFLGNSGYLRHQTSGHLCPIHPRTNMCQTSPVGTQG